MDIVCVVPVFNFCSIHRNVGTMIRSYVDIKICRYGDVVE